MGSSFLEIMVVGAIVLLLFGTKHLGKIGFSLGRAVRQARGQGSGSSGGWAEQAVKAAKMADKARRVGRGGFPWP